MNQTPLNPIGSFSITGLSDTGIAKRMTDLGMLMSDAPLRVQIERIRSDYVNHVADHNREKSEKRMRHLTKPEMTHTDQVIRAFAHTHLQGLGFVRNTNRRENCFGDVGIVFGISYAKHSMKPGSRTIAELTFPLNSSNKDLKLYFHALVAQTDGSYTTWRLNQFEHLSDADGFTQFRTFYRKVA
jgi:hypothetical protein